MKSQLLLIVGLCFITSTMAQQDGFHLYSKPSKINKILPDDTDPDVIHFATDICYLKKTISTNVDVGINLTSQDPAIGAVKDMALDPTSDDIAWTLEDAIAIYNGTDINIYSYHNSGLTIGESTSPFYDLQVTYAQDGSLYVFKEDAFGYQVFNNGVFDIEITTTFQPQDIVENNDGTKTYFAGANNGLWELVKATTTLNNYTTANSNLTNNFLTSLAVDASDYIFIGHFQGLDRLEPNGTFSNCNATVPIAVFDISLSPINDDILVRCSEPNLSYNGLSIVDYDSCSWTNYHEDDSNCLNEDVYTSCSYGGNGLAYVAPEVFSPIEDIGNVYEFSVPSETCTNFDINYLDAPVAVNSNVVTDLAIREKNNGNLEIGFTRTNDLHIIEIDPTTFDGTFPYATSLTPFPVNNLFSIINDNNYFIVETDEGWLFIDENNIVTTFEHNIPDYLAIVTKKSTKYDSDNGIINIIHKGFDASFNYRVYKTQCNMSTGTCSPSEEIFTNDRDLTQDVLFGVDEYSFTNEVVAVGVKTNSSGEVRRTEERWSNILNDTPQTYWDEDQSDYPLSDPTILRFASAESIKGVVLKMSETSLLSRIVDGSGNILIGEHTLDANNDGTLDEFLDILPAPVYNYNGEELRPATWNIYTPRIELQGTRLGAEMWTHEQNENREVGHVPILDLQLNNNIPNDIAILKAEVKQYSPSEVLVVFLTNYGLLVKTGIDISSLTLSDNSLLENSNSVSIFPNPANNVFYIDDVKAINIELIDVNGRQVKYFDQVQSYYNIEDLSKGLYFVKIFSEKNITTKKLIKQ